jgi:hypothetical protein
MNSEAFHIRVALVSIQTLVLVKTSPHNFFILLDLYQASKYFSNTPKLSTRLLNTRTHVRSHFEPVDVGRTTIVTSMFSKPLLHESSLNFIGTIQITCG